MRANQKHKYRLKHHIAPLCLPLCGQGLGEVSRTDIGKKIKEGMEEAAKTAKSSAETVSKGGEMFGKTGAFKAISQVCAHISLLKVEIVIFCRNFSLFCVFCFVFLSGIFITQ